MGGIQGKPNGARAELISEACEARDVRDKGRALWKCLAGQVSGVWGKWYH